ncbi:S10 family peptidase [Massilia sp. BSC265]|uniref:S10 family peptidase n=1 Tax=Massilia sp. BSC265 TaxID=1549812 RepID=UPI0004E8781D|nr:peptidase S10 [Massilia sp. BSC265]KFI08131.1 peptidase S10 [Massilia sp. BSC265]
MAPLSSVHRSRRTASLPALSSLLLAATLAACGGGGGDPAPAPAPVQPPPPVAALPGSYADPITYSGAAMASLASAQEGAATVQARISLDGRPFDYTATAGHLTAADLTTGQAAASFFYVAYTAGTLPAAQRPVTFFFNGGPGSASVWLHLGGFAPRRLATSFPATTPPPSAMQLVDNQETLLDHSDLVFVDAVGTGYSQAIAPRTNAQFWGVDQDAAAFRDFVRRYLAVNNRQASPLYLFGESYGGPRAAVLASLLESAGVRVAGVMLQSPAMNYNANCGVFNPGQLSCEGYLPSYAAVSAYHQNGSLPTDFTSVLQRVREFAAGPYRSEVAAFLANGAPPSEATLTQLSAYTGLPVQTWRQDFSMVPGAYRARFQPGQVIGRYDARVRAPSGSALAAEGDPSMTLVGGAVVGTIRNYLESELRYTAKTPYLSSNNVLNQWVFTHDGKPVPDTIPDLAAAMTLNPALKVIAMGGYHDLATPFYQTELDLARLGAGAAVQVRNYDSGHMSYLDDRVRRLQKADLRAFYNSVSVAQ